MDFPLPFDADLLPAGTCVVGGAVRDALLNRQRSHLDLDLVVPCDAIALSRQIASQYSAGLVILDAERSIARLVFSPVLTVDIAQQVGDSLTSDLYRRDYRMNAIAYHLLTQQIVDPLGGSQDIANQLVRMVSAENLADDPLRLLRGYRQAAQLGFTLEPTTQQTIESLAPLLGRVAAARVLAELHYLLNSSVDNPDYLIAVIESGLLETWLPGSHHPHIRSNVAAVVAAMQSIAAQAPALHEHLLHPIRSTIPFTRAGLTLLAQLLQPLDSQRELMLRNLSASTTEIQAVATVLTHSPQLAQIDPADVTAQYYFFRAVGDWLPIVAVLSMAGGSALEKIRVMIDRYLDTSDPISHPVPLVNGTELMQALNIPPSPLIGQILEEIQLAKIRGEIDSKSDAVSYALSCYHQIKIS